jgi:LPPG:FO 2-phospho-L-lactate transferase
MIAVVAGGVGAARFLVGLVQVVAPADVTAIVNTGDDTHLHGLHISPDLDTVTYTLAGAIDPGRGWGLEGETWNAMEALTRYRGVRPEGSHAATTWFGLGDRDLATHLYRTHRLGEGATLTDVTAEIARAWDLTLRLLPMTDDPVATLVTVRGDEIDSPTDIEMGFQDYFVGHQHAVAVRSVRVAGIDAARPGPEVIATLERADVIVIAPSNPIVSIGPVRAVAGVDDVLRRRRHRVVAVSPIVAGAALKGPADRMLVELGHEASVVGVARLYRDVAATLVIDTADAGLASAVEDVGMHCVVTDTIMREPGVAAALAARVLEGVPG